MDLWIYDSNQEEGMLLAELSRDITAYFSDEKLKITFCESGERMKQILHMKDLLDAALWEIAEGRDIHMIKSFRKSFEMSEILIVAESSISPMKYLTPDIRAASLLIRPFNRGQAFAVLRKFFSSFYEEKNVEDDRVIMIENRQGKISIPINQVYYAEVRERKVFFRLRTKEYGQYTTMENVMRLLPDSFVRCHRSYAFNTRYLERIKLSENTIYLHDGIEVPLSRSYKPVLKEYVDGLHRN